MYPTTVVFAGAHAIQWAYRDLNHDGKDDIVLTFRIRDTTLQSLYSQLLIEDKDPDGVLDSTHQTATATLTAEAVGQILVEGFDNLDLFLAGKSLRTLLDQLAAVGAI